MRNTACDEPFGREQAFGYKAEDEYDDKDDSTRSGTPDTNIFSTKDLEFEKLVNVRY
jgi:hypothetical protein